MLKIVQKPQGRSSETAVKISPAGRCRLRKSGACSWVQDSASVKALHLIEGSEANKIWYGFR